MSDTMSVNTAKRGLFGRKKNKQKVNYKEAAADEKRRRSKTTKSSNPNSAMTEAEPFAQAQAATIAVSQLKHKDLYGNDIVDPDRSNPTRSRMERPLDTIRSFERAVYNDGRDSGPRRQTRSGDELGGHYRKGPYDAQTPGTQSLRQTPRPESYENSGAYQDNYSQHGRNVSSRAGLTNDTFRTQDQPRGYPQQQQVPGTADTNSDSYASAERSTSTNDHYSTDPSSESSSYGYREHDNYTTAPQKAPSPLARSQMAYNQQNPYNNNTYGQSQQQANHVHGHVNGIPEESISATATYEPYNNASPRNIQRGEYYYSHQTYNGQDQYGSANAQNYYFPEHVPRSPQPESHVNQYSHQGYSQTSAPQVHGVPTESYQQHPAYHQQQQSQYPRGMPNSKVLTKINSGVSAVSPTTEKRRSWFRRSKSIKS